MDQPDVEAGFEHGFVPRVDPRPDDRPWPPVSWPPAPGAVLTGETVELRPTTPEDAADLFVALDDIRVWEHLQAEQPYRLVAVRELVEQRAAVAFMWTVRLRASGEVVGWSGYFHTSVEHARTEIGGTQYAVSVWGTRVNPETKLLLLGHAFDVLGMGRVELKTDVRNHRSQRAIAKLGAQFEGVLRRHQRREDGTVRDSVLFSVTAEDWPRVRSGLQERLAADDLGSRP